MSLYLSNCICKKIIDKNEVLSSISLWRSGKGGAYGDCDLPGRGILLYCHVLWYGLNKKMLDTNQLFPGIFSILSSTLGPLNEGIELKSHIRKNKKGIRVYILYERFFSNRYEVQRWRRRLEGENEY